MDSESFYSEGVRRWLKQEEKLLRKMAQHPSSNPKHKAILEKFETCDVLKITTVTTKTQTLLNSH